MVKLNPSKDLLTSATSLTGSWQIDGEALYKELRELAALPDLSSHDRSTIEQALELVEYEIGNGAGVAVVPSTALA